jgi:tRNA(Ile)-lysidine synthase
VLAHILRGTGIAGLAGIHATTQDGIVRPLLEARREELRKYLRAKKQAWREDATNQDTSRQRARMRKKLLPLLEKQFNPKTVNHLSELAGLAREDEALAEAFSRDHYDVLVKQEANRVRITVQHVLWPFSWPAGETANQAMGKRLVRRAFAKLASRHGQLTLRHVQQVMDLAEAGENGKELQLPGNVDVRRDDDELLFVRRSGDGKARAGQLAFSYQIELPEQDTCIAVKELSCIIRLRSIDWHSAQRETIEKGDAALDREKLQGALLLRNLRPGDRMRPAGHRGAQKLKRLLNEKRISRWDRASWPVLDDGKNIVWARGFVAAEFAATSETRKAILVSEEKA